MNTENRADSDMDSDAAEKIDKIPSDITEAIARISREADRFVHERPWTAVAVGAIAGLAIGVLLKSRD